MFEKINIGLKRTADPEKFRGKYVNTYGNIAYYTVNRYYLLIPSTLLRLQPDTISWTEVAPSANLPHRDQGVITNLNMYIDPQNAIVKFYRQKEGAIGYSPNPKTFYPNLFHHRDLDLFGEFQAEPYTSYLLDVSNVHEVLGLTEANRTMIQLSWYRKTFTEISDQIRRL